MLARLGHVIATGGVSALPWRGYSYVYKTLLRPLMPNLSPITYNGVPIGKYRKVGDRYIDHVYMPPDVDDHPDYEQGLVTALKTHVRSGDRIVVVGGGFGVTVVVAAQWCGPLGSVLCFEGDREGVANVRRTAQRNGVDGRVSVTHAIVGEDIGVYGKPRVQTMVSAQQLPPCDILELDCEGSEIGILREMRIAPRVIAVETHGFLGASSAEVGALLAERGYAVTDLGLAEPRLAPVCAGKDIRVLVGVRR